MKRIELEQSSDQWHQWRAGGMGGSNIHKVFAGSRLEKNELIRQTVTGEKPYFPDHIQKAMARGIALEPAARRLAEIALAVNLPPVCVESEINSRLRVSLDGLSPNGLIVLEVKCLARDTHMRVWRLYSSGASPSEALPANYYSQVQYQLMVTEADIAYYAGYNPEAEKPFYLIPVQPNFSFHAMLKETTLAYLDKLDRAKGMPNIIGISGYARSGKDTIARWLGDNWQYMTSSLAAPLKEEMVKLYDMPVLLSDDIKEEWRQRIIDHSKKRKEVFGEDYWVSLLIENTEEKNVVGPNLKLVVPDVRYVHEHIALKKWARDNNLTYVLWGVIRSEKAPNEDEAMSVPLVLDLADHIFDNKGTIEQLYEQLKEREQYYAI